MIKYVKATVLLILLFVFIIPSINAYDIPQRKIEIKPYLNMLFPSDFWQQDGEASIVDNKTSFGFGMKIRTQFSQQFGLVINTAYSSFEVPENLSSSGVIFTGGGYYSKSFNFGNVTFDLGYGIIIAAEQAMGLLMPTLEYSRPVSERISIAVEFGMPIPNDWPRDFEFKENYSSFTISLGSTILF